MTPLFSQITDHSCSLGDLEYGFCITHTVTHIFRHNFVLVRVFKSNYSALLFSSQPRFIPIALFVCCCCTQLYVIAFSHSFVSAFRYRNVLWTIIQCSCFSSGFHFSQPFFLSFSFLFNTAFFLPCLCISCNTTFLATFFFKCRKHSLYLSSISQVRFIIALV